MRKRAVLSFVVLPFIICSIISGPTYASDIWIVDGNVDPWADLEDLEDYTPPPVAVPVPDGAGNEDVMLLTDFDYGSLSVSWKGALNGYFYTAVNNGSPVPAGSASSASWSVSDKGAYRFTLFQNTRTNAYGGYFQATGSNYVEFNFGNTFPEFSAAVELSFSLYYAFCWSKGLPSPVYDHYLGPQAVQLWTGSEWLTCEFTWTAASGESTLNVTVSLTPSQAQGFSAAPIVRVIQTSTGASYGAGGTSSVTSTSLIATVVAGVQSISYEIDAAGETAENVKGIFATVKAIFQSIINLPMNIANFIIDGFKSLFVPTAEQLQAISAKYNDLFEEKLGFVYQMFSFVVDAFGQFKDTLAAGETYSFTFPGIQFPHDGEMVVILPETAVSLDNPVMDVLRPILGTLVSIICVLALVSTGFDMVVAVMSGASYLEFFGQRREDLDI